MDDSSTHAGNQLMEEFNATDDASLLGHCIHKLFERVVEYSPNKAATICGDREVSYGELNLLANRLAWTLNSRGIGSCDLVVVALDRSIELVVALLGILKAGAAYLPIDTTFPLARVSQMMDDAEPKAIITHDMIEVISPWRDVCLNIRKILESDPEENPEQPQIELGSDDVAYIIYTSGSTGKPKGVEISHGSVCNLLLSMKKEPGFSETDRMLAVTTISFDMAVPEIFLPLICGGSTVIAQEHEVRNASAVMALMKRHSITIMEPTPSLWQLLIDSGWQGSPRLKTIISSGEPLPPRLAKSLLNCGDAVWNFYGPTEATVFASFWRVREGDMLIGSPIANTQLYVLDQNLSPVPNGSTGELYIGGAGVARCYRNNIDLSQNRFLENPFHGGRMYQTGDLARFVRSGTLGIQVLGRNDNQVKIRGYRVELGDIEIAITDHVRVSQALVISHDERLVAYCIRDRAQKGIDEDQYANIAEWSSAWDHVYGTVSQNSLVGWRNSYDGAAFSEDEMRDWQMSSVQRILKCSPDRIVDVGSGSGLMLFSIAPHCSFYYATDLSAQVVEATRQKLGSLTHVVCEHREAHALPTDGDFDTVIINSVAQYFPSIDYLVSVLEKATRAIVKGRIYLGDIRNLSHLEVFHADILTFRSKDRVPPAELARRAVEASKEDRELVISPDFFADLPSFFPRVTRVEIALRNGQYHNEMSRYRYDVMLHIGEVNNVCKDIEVSDWSNEKLDTPSLRRILATADGRIKRLNGIPNGRLRDVHSRVGSVLGPIACSPRPWVDPYELQKLASEFDWEVAFLPNRQDKVWMFDAVFWRAGEVPDLSLHPPEPMQGSLSRYANVPKQGGNTLPPLSRILRPWLAKRLPAYMVPTFFVELDEFPLTLTGKIDRKALPNPVERGTKESDRSVKPATELERDILTIWTEVLGHDQIDVDDNFFEIGGDSLRVVRLVTKLKDLVNRDVSPAIVFEHYTIRTLAGQLASSSIDLSTVQPTSITSGHLRNVADEDIAIIATSCRLPGDIATPDAFWDLLETGGDAIIDVPKDRWNVDALYDPDPNSIGKTYCRQGGFISSIDSIDGGFFNITPREARSLDPMQYLMLETSWEAFERAGYTRERLLGSQTGVFVGISNLPAYQGHTYARSLEDLDGNALTGSASGTISGRISYTLGLEGPTMTVDTACSASLVTTHLACAALRRGECNMALSGGVSLLMSPGVFVEFSRARGMAPDGRCRAFAEDTQGTGWSEGCATVILKRLSDAQKDGDPILAVLRGTTVNHCGRGASLTTPSGPAQKRLIQKAIAESRLQPSDIDYIEAHGTATKLGDPIEGAALAEVFGRNKFVRPEFKTLLGSAKSNLGHTQAAAGLVGVLKVVYAMQHEILPKTLYCTNPTTAIDWEKANMEVVQQNRPWPSTKERLRRAGVSAFGIGGTNAHVVVEEYARDVPQVEKMAPLPHYLPIILSGHTDNALRQQAMKLRVHLMGRDHDLLSDVAYSLATTRTHFRRRLTLMAHDKEGLIKGLTTIVQGSGLEISFPSTKKARLALLFTGQGSQLVGMGRDLARHHPVFRDSIEEIATIFTELDRPLLDVMWEDEGLLQRTDYAQPAIFAYEVSLWRLWTSWGVQPVFLMGHSIGELAAAHVAGVMTLKDACRLVAARGRLMQLLPKGGMVSLQASAAETEEAITVLGLNSKVNIAGYNTPSQTVVSGDTDAVEVLDNHFVQGGRKSKKLQVSHAFHSHHIDGMLADFQAVAETIEFHPPNLSIVSSVTGKLATAGQLERPEYWIQQARCAVRFSDGILTLADEGVNISLEIGPQPILCGLGAACLVSNVDSIAWLPSASARETGISTIQESLAELHKKHISVDWLAYFKPFGCKRVELPTYAFQRERIQLAGRPAPPLRVERTLNQANDINTVNGAQTHPLRYAKIRSVANRQRNQKDTRETMADASPTQNLETILAMVRETAAQVLGFATPDAVDIDSSMQDLGIDSLMAVHIRNKLMARTGLDMPPNMVSGHGDLRDLSEWLLSRLQGDRGKPKHAASMSSGPSIREVWQSEPVFSPEDLHRKKSYFSMPSIAPLNRVLSPPLGLNPTSSPQHLFSSAMKFFSKIPWSSRLIYEPSPRNGLLPGYGLAIPFVPQCFNPASSRHDQFFGKTLSHANGSPLRHMLSLFRPSDPSHLDDAARYVSRVSSLFALGEGTSGHEGILHGGLTSTLLDECLSVVSELNTALSKIGNAFAAVNVTASLNVRFLAPIDTSETVVCVTTWIENIQGRTTTMKGIITNGEGERLAEAESVFISKAMA